MEIKQKKIRMPSLIPWSLGAAANEGPWSAGANQRGVPLLPLLPLPLFETRRGW